MNGLITIPLGDYIEVTAALSIPDDPQYADAGITVLLIRKPSNLTPDNDPSVITYTAPLEPDPDRPGYTRGVFKLPSADNTVPGLEWFRVDCRDALGNKRTAETGTIITESV